ncbi:MAG: peptidase S58 family protein [Deltaproteobacteria bacterium HGW-Deltaproteobacteria-12]|jgi:L-aminopeptidase/D-esterase-like protein|nr:MAG: peptidase S58 family protein [Deltaproteobacteria bacterium HGW-Deltaproteobacteria-12]
MKSTERSATVAAGKKNSLTDVEGIMVGHFTDVRAACGVSVAICPEGATAGADVRGSAPGTRETDLLAPLNLIEKVQAVVLTGGSVYGLSSADGVVRWLAKKGWGFPLEDNNVAPIVPAAALFDLGRGASFIPPIGSEWGAQACANAGNDDFPLGSVGAGTGAQSGGIKGGLGTASEVLDSGLTVAAMVAVNSLGTIIDNVTGRPWEVRMEVEGEFGELGQRSVVNTMPQAPKAGRNTTIGIVATDAVLTKAQAQKIAQMAHDGMARAIRPAHTMFDGDTIFCLATNKKDLPDTPGFFAAPKAMAVNEIGRAAADCMTRAIIRGILAATGINSMVAFRDLQTR